MADLEAVCREFGIPLVQPRSGGSHFKVHYPGLREYVTVPFRRPIKPVYIRQFVHFVDLVRHHDAHS